MAPSEDSFEDLLNVDPYASIPAEMKAARSWLVYRFEPGEGGRKNKIPYDPKTGRKANNPKLGVTFEEAKAASKNFSGIGFYVEAPYIVIDIDGCVDKDGNVADYAVEIVREINSFTEASPSGTGLHIWGKGEKPGAACRKGIEIYSTKRFLTVTGVQVPGTPCEIRDVDVKSVYNRMLAGEFDESKSAIGDNPESQRPATKISTEVQHGGGAITTKIQLLMTGNIIFTRPFRIEDEHGNYLNFPSQSEADMSLANHLAIKHKGDAEKIDADFRVSSLYRDKWDRPDYRDNTIKAAVTFYKKREEEDRPPQHISSTQVFEAEEALPVVEDKLPEFPNFTGSLRDLSDALSQDIPYPFKMAAAFAHMGLIRSGLDTLSSESHIQPRLYVALIAEPGRGKTAAINEVGKVMKSLSQSYRAFSSIDSGPSLVDTFQDQNNQAMQRIDVGESLIASATAKVLLDPDEIKGLFEKSKITNGSRNSMLDELLKLYEGNTTGNRARGAKAKIHIENAHLGLLGGATELGYAGMWAGTAGASGGLQSRVIPVGIEYRKMPSMQRKPDAEKMAAAIQRLSDQIKKDATQFEICEEAFEIFDRWWSAKEQARSSEVRVDGVVKRILIILARTNDVEVIGPDLVNQAIEFGDFVIACREKFNPLDATTWVQMFENLIISTYQKHGDLSKRNCRRFVHPERRSGGVGPFLQAFDNMVKAGILAPSGDQKNPVYKLAAL